MKKLTIFRRCSADFITDRIDEQAAYETYHLAKVVNKELGRARLIISSHAPCAMNTGRIIQLTIPEVRLMEDPFLSPYYSDDLDRFIKKFMYYAKNGYRHYDHIIVVTHSMTISKLSSIHVKFGNCVTLEAETWEDIFDKTKQTLSTPYSRYHKEHGLTEVTDEVYEYFKPNCSDDEKNKVNAVRG